MQALLDYLSGYDFLIGVVAATLLLRILEFVIPRYFGKYLARWTLSSKGKQIEQIKKEMERAEHYKKNPPILYAQALRVIGLLVFLCSGILGTLILTVLILLAFESDRQQGRLPFIYFKVFLSVVVIFTYVIGGYIFSLLRSMRIAVARFVGFDEYLSNAQKELADLEAQLKQ